MTYAGALLPVTALALVWFLLSVHRRPLGLDRLSTRGTFVVAHVVFQALVLAITEILDLGRHIDRLTVAGAWLLIDAALVGLVAGTIGRDGVQQRLSMVSKAGIVERARGWPLEVYFGLGTIVWIVLTLVGIGWIYPPNNTDSLVYHLTRVAHWIQESSVDHFATHWTGQIELAPLHEFDMLHLHLLTGSDRLDGFVQLLAFVVCVVGASEIARLLGATLTTQVVAAVIAAVVPSAILEATSTQNNVFAAAIAVGIFVVVLAWIPAGRWLAPSIVLGLGCGLAVIAKGTVMALIVPAVVLLASRLVILECRMSSWRVVVRRAAGVASVVIVCAVLMAGPFLKRNHDVFGTFTGPITATTVNEELRVREGVANIIRSVATNFRIGDGDGGFDTLTSKVALGSLRPLYDLLDVPQDDLDFYITPFADAFETSDFSVTSRFEEFGANPWHVVLIVVSLGVLIYRAVRRRPRADLAALLAVGLAAGFVAFSGTARWSIYVARYSLPILVVWAALIAVALDGLNRIVRNALVALLVVASVPQLLDNWPRSLQHPRNEFATDLDAYFVGRVVTEPSVAAEFVAVRDAIVRSGCGRVGIANWVLLEYPLWAGLDNAGWEGEIEHVDVDNESRVLERTDFEPCLLVRQSSGPPFDLPPGWTEVPFGSLSLASDPAASPAS